jgi:S1-C subfamily serine protease
VAVAVVVVAATAGGVLVGLNVGGDGGDEPATSARGGFFTTTSTSDEGLDLGTQPLVYTAEELVAELGPAVWRVETDGCDETWSGTAWAIDDHHLGTNHHVVANSTRPELRSRDGERLGGTVIGWSERPDVAVIRADRPLGTGLEWAPTVELREGQSLLGGGPALDALWDQCAAGDFQSCDDLWWMAPPGSDYERFGGTCGDRNRPAGWRTEVHGS